MTCDLCNITDLVTNLSQYMIDCDICDMSCNSNHIKVIMAKVVYNTILVALSLFVIENNIYRCGCYGSIVQ